MVYNADVSDGIINLTKKFGLTVDVKFKLNDFQINAMLQLPENCLKKSSSLLHWLTQGQMG